MSYCAYILHSKKLDRFYVGMSDNLEQRIKHHNNPIFSEKFTARGIPWELFLTIPCDSKKQALKMERLIKSKKSKIFIESLQKDPQLIKELIEQSLSDC